MSNNCISFKLKSTNNEYFITIRLLDDKEPQKLEISLKHKLKTGDIDFLLQKSLEELKCENNYLSQFNSIKEIFDYFIKIIKSQNMQIVKPITPNIDFYYMEFFDQEKQIYLQIYIPKEAPIIKELEEKNKKLEREKEYLISEIERISNINDGKCKGVDESIVQSGLSGMAPSNSMQIREKEKNILKENNNNISFRNEPVGFGDGKKISVGKDECENFTAFINMNQGSLIVWTIKRKGIIYIYDFKKDLKTKKEEAHNNNINSVQYFHDHNENIDYIISLSKLDDDIIKIWKIDYEKDNKLLLIQSFTKHFFKREIEIFCIFNYDEYDEENSFLFIYGKSLLIKKNNEEDVNKFKNKEIICYKLNKDLNNIIWGKDDNDHDINYKTINNFYKINFLDTYYDMSDKRLYLINCNENNTEIIFNLFENDIGIPFKYNGWNYYHSAFMKEINNVLKLFQLSTNGIAIWDIKKKILEAYKYFDDICLFDFIFWNSDYIITLSDKKIITLKISGENIEIKAQKNKEKGYSKIRKIISPGNSEFIVAIDNHQVKYWSF